MTIRLSWIQLCITPLGISEIALKFISDIPFFSQKKHKSLLKDAVASCPGSALLTKH